MKTLHVPLETQEYKKLKKRKGKLTWKEFIFKLLSENGKRA